MSPKVNKPLMSIFIRMKLIDVSDIKNVDDTSSVIIKIPLDVDNLSKFPMEILYHKEKGFYSFLLSYSFEKIKIPLSRIVTKIRENIFKIIKSYDVKIYVSGIPLCVFERDILRPGLRWKYEDKLFYYSEENEEEKIEYTFNYDGFEKVVEIPKLYFDKFGPSEYEPNLNNLELLPLFEKEFSLFKNQNLIDISKKILEDYREDKYYLRKRIVFVNSFSNKDDNAEASLERFVYYIYNRGDDFDKTYSFLCQFVEENFLFELKKYLEISNQFVISFASMVDGILRTSFYFSVEEFEDSDLDEIEDKFKFKFNRKNLGGVGFDFKEGKLNSVKVYSKYDKILNSEIKQFFVDYKLDSKKILFKLLNSFIKPLECVLLDDKYRNGELYSKRVDISAQFNKFKLNHLTNVIEMDVGFLSNKEFYTISFEVTHEPIQKINFYYSLTLKPIELLELEGEEEPQQ